MHESGRGSLGLIAGGGVLPLAIARAARVAGRAVTAIAFPDHSDPALEAEVDALAWQRPGEIGAAARRLCEAGVREAVLAGPVTKAGLIGDPRGLGLDDDAVRLLSRLPDHRDASILAAIAEYLERSGIRLLAQTALVPELVAPEGVLGRIAATPEQQGDVAFALPLARELARLDIGQTLVVRGRAVLAVEAMEGTDAAIRRAGRLAPGACAVKLARPDQDPRFDVPAVGPGTIAALVDAKAALLAVEAGGTLLLERDATLAAADAAGIALLGIRP